jgi:hypothetical protein
MKTERTSVCLWCRFCMWPLAEGYGSVWVWLATEKGREYRLPFWTQSQEIELQIVEYQTFITLMWVIYWIQLNSMQLSPWEANSWSSTQQEIARILWNPKVQCHFHNSPPLVPVLSQINSAHPRPCYSLKSILILSSHLGLPICLFPSGFPTKTQYALLCHACYMLYWIKMYMEEK